MLISTGSQGEPLSALSRIAQRNHHFVHIEEGDTVVLASSLIPGNENAVYRVINGLARWGAHVVHKGNALVHVSGHASAGELLYCYNIVKPRNVLPVHGEIRHMLANAELARATGIDPERVVIAEDGVVVDLVDGVAKITGKVDCGYVFVDGSSIGDLTESSLKDRRILGEEGFISVIVVIDSQTGKVVSGPEIHARGFAEDDTTFEEIKRPDHRRARQGGLRGRRRHLPAAADHPAGRRPLGQRHPPPAADDHPGRPRGLGRRVIHARDGRPDGTGDQLRAVGRRLLPRGDQRGARARRGQHHRRPADRLRAHGRRAGPDRQGPGVRRDRAASATRADAATRSPTACCCRWPSPSRSTSRWRRTRSRPSCWCRSP